MSLAAHAHRSHVASAPAATLSAGRRGRVAALGSLAVLLGAMTWPLVSGRVPLTDDLGAFHLPVRAFYAEQLARGEPFDWMPSLFAGFYISGEGQGGGYHPLHLALYRALPLATAFNLELWLSYAALAAGSYFFFRGALRHGEAAALAATTFAFGSFNFLHYVHPNAVAVVGHIPWLLLMTDIAARRGQVAPLAAIALLTGSQLLLGYPQYVWFSLLAEGAWLAWRLAGGGGLRLALSIAAAKLAGLLLGAVQLLPTLDALLAAARQDAGPGFAATGALHPLNVFQLVGPYLFADRVVGGNTHEAGLYIGAVPIVLLAWMRGRPAALGRLRRPALVIAAGVALALALGPAGGLYRLQMALPLVGSFRCPCRYLMLTQLALAALAATGFIALARQGRRARQSRGPAPADRAAAERALLGIVLLSAVAATVGLVWRGERFGTPWAVAAGPLLLAVAAGLIGLAARGSRVALAALMPFTALDLGAYGLSYAVYRGAERIDDYIAGVAAPPRDGTRIATDLARPNAPGVRMGNQWSLLGFNRVDGYAGLEPRRSLDYRTVAALRAATVGWVQRNEFTASVAGLRAYDEHWLAVPSPLPKARLLADWKRGTAADLQRTDIDRTAIVGDDLPPPALPAAVALASEIGAARLATLYDRPGQMAWRAACPAPRLLVVAESHHPGWTARIDGRPVAPVRANGDFLGVPLAAGDHHVELIFDPASLRWGRRISACGAIVVLGIVVTSIATRTVGRGPRVGGRNPAAASEDRPNGGRS